MKKTIENLTVFFEDPFWVGVFERVHNSKLSVCKVTFGAEPKDYEIWEFILKHYNNLNFSDAVKTKIKKTADSPKRRQRNAKKQISTSGVGTKSQQALKLQHEKIKSDHKRLAKKRKKADKQRVFDLKQQKRKEKHKGH
ncbi:MAG: YjdF family protein [Clostridia bacterium]|nr:YjdF family protein [Clostridia bacterium]